MSESNPSIFPARIQQAPWKVLLNMPEQSKPHTAFKEKEMKIEIGWLVMTSDGPMFWPIAERSEAELYCEDGAEPVKLWANETEVAAHETAQGATHD